MAAIDDLKGSIADLKTSISTELAAISAKLGAIPVPNGTSDADIQAVISQVNALKATVDAETASLA